MDLLDCSIKLLQEFEPLAIQADPRGYCVCSSFGKDSMALIEVFKIAKVKFWVKWNVTGVDPPELFYFAKEQTKTLESHGIYVFKQMYDKSMRQLIVEHKVPPSRIIRYCCDELKEKVLPQHKNSFFSFGVRKAESSAREGRNEIEVIHRNKNKRLSLEFTEQDTQLEFDISSNIIYLNSDNHENRKQFETCMTKGMKAVNPLVYWSDKFLWDFIKSENVPCCCLYKEGFKRLGCIGCPMANKSRHFEFKRYPGMYNYYLSAFEEMLIKRKEDGVDKRREIEGKPPLHWNTAQDVIDWWLQEKKNENQLSIEA